jgi:hypothetical protein
LLGGTTTVVFAGGGGLLLLMHADMDSSDTAKMAAKRAFIRIPLRKSECHSARMASARLSSVTVSWRRLRPTPIAAATLVLLCACSSLQQRGSTAPGSRSFGAQSTVYVVRRSWHIDVGFAADDLVPPLVAVRADFPGVNYLSFGFGDRRYLLHKGGLSMLTALWPGPGLVLATGLRAVPEEAFGQNEVVRLSVSRAQMIDLQQFVWRTLTTHDGRVTPLQAGPYPGSLYYESPQRYSALHTCNTWAAEALKSAGLSVTSTGVEFASELWVQVIHLRDRQRSQAEDATDAVH